MRSVPPPRCCPSIRNGEIHEQVNPPDLRRGGQPRTVYDILTTTEGQGAFWTGDCDVNADHARFGFPGEATVEVEITTQPERLVRMHSTSGVTHGGNVTWEYELHPAGEGTTVLFREYGFSDDHPEIDMGRTAQTWARIMDRLVNYVATGTPQPFFPAITVPDRLERERRRTA